jgi:hypothetical protein
VTLDKVEQFLFVRFDILVAGKIAEFHVVCEKSHFESIADEREGNFKPVIDLLLNSVHDLLFAQISKELEHSFETMKPHLYLLWLSEPILSQQLFALVCSDTSTLGLFQDLFDRRAEKLAWQLTIYRAFAEVGNKVLH